MKNKAFRVYPSWRTEDDKIRWERCRAIYGWLVRPSWSCSRHFRSKERSNPSDARTILRRASAFLIFPITSPLNVLQVQIFITFNYYYKYIHVYLSQNIFLNMYCTYIYTINIKYRSTIKSIAFWQYIIDFKWINILPS